MTEEIIVEHNCTTGEVEIREMTANEILWLEQARTIPELSEEELAKATAKADLLEKLGITEDEAKLLLS